MTNDVINHIKWIIFQLLYTDNPITSSVSRHNRTAQLQMYTCSYVQYVYSVRSGNQTPRSYFRYFPIAVFQSFRNSHKRECVKHCFWIPSLIHLIAVLAEKLQGSSAVLNMIQFLIQTTPQWTGISILQPYYQSTKSVERINHACHLAY